VGTAIFVAAFVVFGAFAHYLSNGQRTRRAIRRAAHVPIGEARAGSVVKLTGRLRYMGPALHAPLSGRACAYYVVTVLQRRGQSGWATLVEDPGGVDFLIEDTTGRARVVAGGMKAVALEDARYVSGTFNDATPALNAYLARHGLTSEGWLFNKNLQYREAVFEEDDLVTVVGQVTFEPDHEAPPCETGYRSMPQRVVVSAPPEGQVLASDDPSLIAVRR
jgi:hypothetical protein